MTMGGWKVRAVVVLALLVGILSPPMLAGKSLRRAIEEGAIDVDLRYRYENVDQEGFDEDADASTARLRLGFGSGAYYGFSVYVDFEVLRAIGADDYNSTANGKDEFPAVFDPEDEEVNQAYLAYTAPKKTEIRLGRQRIALDNERFVGNVGWRQLEQTFDAISVNGEPSNRISFFAAHLNGANRIFGEHNPDSTKAEMDLKTELASAAYTWNLGTVTAYAHFNEQENTPEKSHRNIGLRFSGKRSLAKDLDLLYTAELTDQSDYEDAPSTVDASYYFGELGVVVERWTVKLGYESLGGDGIYGFQTPLATLHKFNGWTDRFLVTPATGLQDLYASVSRKVSRYKLLGVYHEFSADEGGADYGTELGLSVARSYGDHLSWLIKYANYDADSAAAGAPFALDTEIVWFATQLRF